jgi:hypothetical protein
MYHPEMMQIASIFGKRAGRCGLQATADRAAASLQAMAAFSVAHSVHRCKDAIKKLATRCSQGPSIHVVGSVKPREVRFFRHALVFVA